MKIVELLNNIRLPITNEEYDFLGKFSVTNKITKKDLNEREKVLANNLVQKDVLLRQKNEGKVIYKQKYKKYT